MNSRIKRNRVNHLAMADAVEAMLDGALTRAEIAEQTGLHYLTVGRLQAALHRKGAAHVVGWGADGMGRLVLPLLKIGRGKDAPKPRPLTQAQRNERRRAKAHGKRLQQAMAFKPDLKLAA